MINLKEESENLLIISLRKSTMQRKGEKTVHPNQKPSPGRDRRSNTSYGLKRKCYILLPKYSRQGVYGWSLKNPWIPSRMGVLQRPSPPLTCTWVIFGACYTHSIRYF